MATLLKQFIHNFQHINFFDSATTFCRRTITTGGDAANARWPEDSSTEFDTELTLIEKDEKGIIVPSKLIMIRLKPKLKKD